MEYQIRLLPSGRTFSAESESTLLHAALRAGITIPYKCSNGTCGKCLAKIKSGEIGAHIPHDFPIAQSEQIAGRMLLCSNHPGSDMELEVHEISDAHEIPLQSIKTKVIKIERLDQHHIVIELRTPRSETLQFLAGQYVDLRIDGVDGKYHGAIGSCPCNGMMIQFHLQFSDDPFIRHCFTQLKKGDAVMVKGPYGDVTFKEQHNHPAIFIAKDCHFAGVKSLIEQAINLEFDQPVRLYWFMTSGHKHYMNNYCRQWADHFEDYRFIPITLSGKIIESEDIKSVMKQIITEYPQLNIDLYLSMPKSRARVTKRYLYDLGIEPERVMSLSKNTYS